MAEEGWPRLRRGSTTADRDKEREQRAESREKRDDLVMQLNVVCCMLRVLRAERGGRRSSGREEKEREINLIPEDEVEGLVAAFARLFFFPARAPSRSHLPTRLPSQRHTRTHTHISHAHPDREKERDSVLLSRHNFPTKNARSFNHAHSTQPAHRPGQPRHPARRRPRPRGRPSRP